MTKALFATAAGTAFGWLARDASHAEAHPRLTSLPAQPRTRVIVPPPATSEAALKRLGEGFECVDWYLRRKQV